jgi:hypothetical protein
VNPLNLLARWATASHAHALDNAREAAVRCSRARVERAEVEAFVAAYAGVARATAPERATEVAVGVRGAGR